MTDGVRELSPDLPPSLRGAVVGGGLEPAAATHVRVAERSAFYALPQGQRGLFTGGGGSVRVTRPVGTAAVTDLMLTGRLLDATEGHRLGLTQYLVGDGEGAARATELARSIATNSPITNHAVLHVLPRIAEVGPDEGLVMESLVAAVAQGSDEAKERLRDFLEGRGGRVTDRRDDPAPEQR